MNELNYNHALTEMIDEDIFQTRSTYQIKVCNVASAVVETIFKLFHNFENFKILDFRAARREYFSEFFLWAARRLEKNSNFFNMEKNYFLLKIIFSLIFIALKVLRM